MRTLPAAGCPLASQWLSTHGEIAAGNSVEAWYFFGYLPSQGCPHLSWLRSTPQTDKLGNKEMEAELGTPRIREPAFLLCHDTPRRPPPPPVTEVSVRRRHSDFAGVHKCGLVAKAINWQLSQRVQSGDLNDASQCQKDYRLSDPPR